MSEIATLPGEDRRARLLAALTCAWQAIRLFEQLEHTQYLQAAENTLRGVWQACGDEAESLWQAAGLGALPDLTTSPSNLAEADWQALLQRFAAIQDEDALIEFWQAVPSELEAPFIQIVAGLIEQAQSAGDEATVSALQARLEGFKAISAQAATASSPDPQQHQPPMADLQAAIETFQNLAKQANNDANNLELWQQAIQAGEAMLEKLQPFAERVPLNEFETAVAQTYNSLGVAQDDTDKQAALQSYARAMALQPQEAMYWRNYADTLIELGQLALAEQAIAQAQQLEPNAPRLAQLRADLAQARAAISA